MIRKKRRLASVVAALVFGLVAGCEDDGWVNVRDPRSGFVLRLPPTWRLVDGASMAAYQDAANPEYAFWIAAEKAPRAEGNAHLFEDGSVADILDRLLAGNPVAPELLRRQEIGSERALAFYRVTRFVTDGAAQYSWTLVERNHDAIDIGVFTLAADPGASEERTKALLGGLWNSIAELEIGEKVTAFDAR